MPVNVAPQPSVPIVRMQDPSKLDRRSRKTLLDMKKSESVEGEKVVELKRTDSASGPRTPCFERLYNQRNKSVMNINLYICKWQTRFNVTLQFCGMIWKIYTQLTKNNIYIYYLLIKRN